MTRPRIDLPRPPRVTGRWRGGIAVLLATVLAACAPTPPPAESASAASAVPAALASARGRVDVDGGILHLAARRDGVIDRVFVEEGDAVKAGQVLATLDDDLAQRTLSLVRSEQRLAEQDTRRARIDLDAARRELARLQQLATDETASRQELDRARDARQLAEVTLRSAEIARDIAQARLAVAERELEERRIVAPLDGRILQRHARPGNGVSTLTVTPLFLFAPHAPMTVRAEVEEQYLDALTLDQPVEVVLEAQPARRWPGHVRRIGQMVGARTPGDDPAERQDNRVVEVLITLPDAPALRIGQRVIVRFLDA